MKYCSKCGNEVLDDAVICTKCGCKIEGVIDEEARSTSKTLGWIAIIGGAFIPLVGWICGGIGLSKANKAKYGTGRTLNTIGLVISTIMFIIYFSLNL
ncbi:MAG: zinc-ribbon domain-containing protein [Christensenellales bacterium]|jgi:hypothetical protein